MCIVKTETLSEKWTAEGKYKYKKNAWEMQEKWLNKNPYYFNYCLLINAAII